MKNIKKNDNNIIDAMAEARKSKEFQEYSDNAEVRIRLAIEIYNARGVMGLNQQELAKEIGSTQREISRLENGDVNLGIELLNKIIKKLHLDSNKIFSGDPCVPVMPLFFTGEDNEYDKIDFNTDPSVANINADETNTIKLKQTIL
jgi:DNA-binding XRE family transcriptional regulator